MPGLDPFQLVALLLQLLKLDKPQQGDDVADYQQFVASGAHGCGKAAEWLYQGWGKSVARLGQKP
jgi:hypothetical protein